MHCALQTTEDDLEADTTGYFSDIQLAAPTHIWQVLFGNLRLSNRPAAHTYRTCTTVFCGPLRP